MPSINFQKLLRLPVYTESGSKLGRVYDLDLDIDTHNVMRYVIKANILSAKKYLIQNFQIKSISDDKIIVYDTTISAFAKADAASEE